MPDVQHKRGSRAALDTLAAADGLLVGQVYVVTDEDRLAVALSIGSYQSMAKEGEGGSGDLLASNNLSDVANAGTSRTNLGLAIGTDVQAYDADTLKANTTANLTAAFTAAIDDDGTITTGTYTPTAAAGSQYKKIVGGGAFTLAPPVVATNTATTLSLFIINNSSAGAITTSGFTKVAGDAFTTTDAHKFSCRIEVNDIGGTEYSTLTVLAMQ